MRVCVLVMTINLTVNSGVVYLAGLNNIIVPKATSVTVVVNNPIATYTKHIKEV